MKKWREHWQGLGRKSIILLAFALMMTLLRLFLAGKAPLMFHGEASHDDFLMVRYAAYMVAGQWMGPYSVMVCVKGISFPLFLAINYLLGISYPITLMLCNVASAYFFIQAIKPWLKSPAWRIVLYLFLIYSPATYATESASLIYRNALLPPALLLVLGCAIGLYLRREAKGRSLLPWSIGLGLSFAFFWNIREDTIWLLPFVVAALLATGVHLWVVKGRPSLKRILLLILPLFILAGAQVGQALINQAVYGQFMINNRTGTACADVITDLLHIDDGEDNRVVWISKDAIAMAYEASPTLKSAKASIDEAIGDWDSTDSDRGLDGDIIVWAIRDGVYRAGYYVDAQETETFYRTVDNELKAALANGTLPKREAFYVSGAARGMTVSDIPLLSENMCIGLMDLITYKYYAYDLVSAMGSTDHIRTMEIITGTDALYDDALLVDGNETAEKIQISMGNICNKVFDLVTLVYQKTGIVLALLGIIGYGLITVQMVSCLRKGKDDVFELWLVLMGMAISILILFFGVVWFTSWMEGDYDFNIYYYTTPAVTLLQIMEFLTIYHGVSMVYHRIKSQ